MSQVSEAIQKVRNFAALPGWSKSKLAVAAGLNKNTLRDLDKPDVVFATNTLEQLEAFINTQPEQ